VENIPLPRYNRKTTLRVKLVDRAANVSITVGGLGVIAAVLGIIIFVASQVIPLFSTPANGIAGQPTVLEPGETLLLHTDEYRRVGVRINRNGRVTQFSVSDGTVISSEVLPQLRGATLTTVAINTRTRTNKQVGRQLDVPHHLLLLGTSDGRVLVGSLGYFTDFERYAIGEDPAELEALRMPPEEDFREISYVPQVLVRGDRVYEHLPTFGLYRYVRALFEIEREVGVELGGRAVVALAGQVERARADANRGATLVIVTDDGVARVVRESISVNMFTEEVEVAATAREFHLQTAPQFALINDQQDTVLLAARDGTVTHITWNAVVGDFVPSTFAHTSVFSAEVDVNRGRSWRDIVASGRHSTGLEPASGDPQITAAAFVLGSSTAVFGDSLGGLQSWFLVRSDGGEGQPRLIRSRALMPMPGAIVSISPSPMTKAVLAVDDQGHIRAVNNTAERVFAELQLNGATTAVFNRKGDSVLAATDEGQVHTWWVDAPHSEISWNTLFGKVWYEEYSQPGFEWQSTGGTDDVEPKLSLRPLILGTIKGALYALLFAVPVAVLAAIYTSEFMHRNMRALLKPTMEVMASLPSVVLGFLAALYFAPKAAPMMPTLLCAIVLVPTTFLVFGWFWQRCPPSFVGKFGPWTSTLLLFALLALGFWLSSLVGPRVEVFLFPASEGANPALLDPVTFEPRTEEAATALATGDFRTWTGGGQVLRRGESYGGEWLPQGWWIPGGHNLLIVLIAIPVTLLLGLLVRWAMKTFARGPDGRTFVDRIREKLEGPVTGGMRAVSVDGLFTIGFGALMFIAGLAVSWLITPNLIEPLLFSYDHPTAGKVADFRRFVTGEDGWRFAQSNSLVVGFAMGFAVIPLIYTISEDALTSVPNQLRAASLACGASRWQTTLGVVLPAAASGIFSGIVIGLGRALGETMIVVMAAGGAAVMELQPLSGFRSLSAAIAIEMPEAPHGGTLYRVLFLGGFVLFVMAFVMNTFAEIIRMRLRRRLSRL
jgi:phosphate transport system permease protein